MAVAFDSTVSTSGQTVTTLTTPAFTIGTGASRAAILGFSGAQNTTGITASLGADPGMTIITGTDGGTSTSTVMLSRITTLTGSQTAAASWTNAQDAIIGVVVATGVNQTTPTNNGGVTAAGGTSLTVTSTSGDLTMSVFEQFNGTANNSPTTNQTVRWALVAAGNATGGGGDTGPGTGTTTHTWTVGAGFSVGGVSGANFAAEAGAVVTPRLLSLLGVGT